MQDKAIFIFAPGDNHIQHLEPVFRSIAKHITTGYEFGVLLPDASCSVKSEFPVVTKVISESDLALCNQLYFQESRVDIPPFATYAQLLIPKYFSEYPKILFMEVDQIVKQDLAQLWQRFDSEDIKLGAVRSRNSDGSFGTPPKSFLRVAPEGHYFNMGVVLVDTAFWLEKDYTEKCFSECRKQKESNGARLEFYAQGAMNNALHEYVTGLDFKYNVTGLGYKTDHDPKILDDAVILHWSGSRKPWVLDGLYKRLYYPDYGRLSEFSDKGRLIFRSSVRGPRKFARSLWEKLVG